MIDVVCKALEAGDGDFRYESTCKDFYARIVTGWLNLGIKGARLLEELPRRSS
jgi:hypothetical protein